MLAETTDIDAVITEWIDNLNEVDRMISPLVWDANETNQQNYTAWKANVDYFIELGDKASQDASTFEDWKRVGRNLLSHANDLAQLLNDATISGRIHNFISSFPSSLAFVAKTAVDTASKAAATIIPWYVWVGLAGLGGVILLDRFKKG